MLRQRSAAPSLSPDAALSDPGLYVRVGSRAHTALLSRLTAPLVDLKHPTVGLVLLGGTRRFPLRFGWRSDTQTGARGMGITGEGSDASGRPSRHTLTGAETVHEHHDAEGSELPPWTEIGGYRITALLGRGGMGTVFLGEHDEAGVARLAAIKVLGTSLTLPGLRQRFRLERQVLARLDHPNIARLFEGGETEEGQPYLVIEYVNGGPITEHCDEHALSVRARLKLFLRVCAALAYAHQNLIVHRDIKPSNVLVDASGNVKLLDFSIAKPLEALAEDESLIETSPGQHLLTPLYAAPEQVRGDPVTVATDIYSAGLLLYELLTGYSPYAQVGETHPRTASVLAAINAGETTPASAMLGRQLRGASAGEGRATLDRRARARGEPSVERLRRRLRGDLDTILNTCLSERPQARYASVDALREDIERFLDGRPLNARPPSFRYQAVKFIRRHPWPLAAAASVVLFSMTLAAVMGVQARAIALERDRAEQARRAAELARVEAEHVAEFQAKQLANIGVASMGLDLRAGLIEQVRAALERRAVAPEVIEARLGSLRELVAGANFTDLALDTLEGNIFDGALEVIETEYADRPHVQARLWQTVATTMRELGRYEAAEGPQARALKARQRLLGSDHPDTLSSLDELGALRLAQGRPAEAEPYIRSALDGRRRVLGDTHSDTLASLNHMGFALRSQGKLDAAERYHREALATQRRTLGDDHPETLQSISNLGVLLGRKGHLDAAEPLLREALEGRRQVLGDNHLKTLQSLSNMGILLQARGQLAAAEHHFRAAWEGSRRALGDDHPDTLVPMNVLGGLLREQGQLVAARRLGEQAVERARAILGEQHFYLGVFLASYGRTLTRAGEFEHAETVLKEAYEVLSRPGQGGGPFMDRPVRALVELYQAWHQVEPEAGHDALASDWDTRLATNGGRPD